MKIRNVATGQNLPQKVSQYVVELCLLDPKFYDKRALDDIITVLEDELTKINLDYNDWITTLETLDAVPRKNFFLGENNIKCFDVEEKIETDTDRAKVIVYNIRDKDLLKELIQKKKNKVYVTVKFISPRVIRELVDIKRFYRKLIYLCETSIAKLKECSQGIEILDGEYKSKNNKQEQLAEQNSISAAE